MKITLETITPEYAKQLLLINLRNRPLNKTRAIRIAKAIDRGEWQTNGDAIRISKNNVLLDGQHRLYAAALSSTPIQTLVIRDLPDEVFHTIDVSSRPRSAGDILALKGEKHYSTMAAVASRVYLQELTGNPFAKGSHLITPTTQQIEAIIERTPLIREASGFAKSKAWARSLLPPSTIGFCWMRFQEKNAAACDQFFSQLGSGIGLYEGSPILALRNRLMFEKENAAQITQAHKAALTFKAFKAFESGRKIRTLRAGTTQEELTKEFTI
jgi:hypothetical protein